MILWNDAPRNDKAEARPLKDRPLEDRAPDDRPLEDRYAYQAGYLAALADVSDWGAANVFARDADTIGALLVELLRLNAPHLADPKTDPQTDGPQATESKITDPHLDAARRTVRGEDI